MSELEQLRARVAMLEAMQTDEENENVLVIKGKLHNSGHGEWYAVSVGNEYLTEAIENFRDEAKWKSETTNNSKITLSWHVTDTPKRYAELKMNILDTTIGGLETTFYHAHSDLTGYLWTTEKVNVNGHDLLKEIASAAEGLPEAWVYVRLELHD